ncbi:MAG: polyprenol monophosphomannose synthase [Gemmataceae bacterium]|nr:polyprenol monophosphomannose synthase [Gemmataceae bacterium]
MQENQGEVRSVVPPAVADSRILISTATYNERENLARLIQEFHAFVPTADILVVDDNSPDGTGQLADEMAAKDPRIHVLHRKGKLGLGTAVLAAMNYAIEHGYDLFVNVDADFSHHPRYLPAILAGMQRNDVMIGSRYVPGGGTLGWPLSRKFMSAGVNVVVRLLMRIPAHDTSGGYRCYRVSKLRETDLTNLLSHGYSFQEEVLYRCHRAGSRIGESPIIFEDRREGASKVNLKEVARSMGIILLLGFQSFLGQDKLPDKTVSPVNRG